MEDIVFSATINRVIAGSTIDDVITTTTGNEIIIFAAVDNVLTPVTIDIVWPGRGPAVDDVSVFGSIYHCGITGYRFIVEKTLGTAVERNKRQ
jgi:hypothetical protein